MESLNPENLARLNALNAEPGDPKLPSQGGKGPGRSGAGIDVASIYTHSVIDGEYISSENFTKFFLNKHNLEADFDNYDNKYEYAGWGTYGDQFKFIADTPENDQMDDMADTKQGYQIVNDRRMEKFGWFFERIKIKGFFRCCNEWETEYATLEIQFKTPTGMKDMMKLKQSQQNLQKF